MAKVDRHLAGILEIDGHPMADRRLHPPLAPIRPIGVANDDTGSEIRIHEPSLSASAFRVN